VVTRAIERGIEHGVPFDLELDLVSAKGRRCAARVIATVQREGDIPS